MSVVCSCGRRIGDWSGVCYSENRSALGERANQKPIRLALAMGEVVQRAGWFFSHPQRLSSLPARAGHGRGGTASRRAFFVRRAKLTSRRRCPGYDTVCSRCDLVRRVPSRPPEPRPVNPVAAPLAAAGPAGSTCRPSPTPRATGSAPAGVNAVRGAGRPALAAAAGLGGPAGAAHPPLGEGVRQADATPS